MADIRIKDLPTTATQTASDDFIALDGTVNGTRKIDASAPSFKTSVTSPSIVAPATTALTLAGGSTGASLVLGQGANSPATISTSSAASKAILVLGTTDTGNSNQGIALTNAQANAASRNWALVMNNAAFGDFAILQSNARLGDPISAGTSALTISAARNLLIGTTTDISGTGGLRTAGVVSAAGGVTAATQIQATAGAALNLQNSASDAQANILNIGSSGASIIDFRTASTSRLTIGAAGPVGITSTATATASSAGGGALQVGSNVGLSGNAGGASYFGGAIDLGATTTSANAVRWSADTALYRGAAGYLSMGTAAIGGGFSVQNSSAGGQITVQSAGTPMLNLTDTTQATDAKIWSIRSSSSSLIVGAWPDNFAGISPAITIARSANVPSLVTITPAATFASIVTMSESSIVTKNQNGNTSFGIRNPNGGTASVSALYVGNDTSNTRGSLFTFGSGYTTSNQYVAGSVLLESSDTAGLGISGTNSGPVKIWNNAGVTATFTATGTTFAGAVTVTKSSNPEVNILTTSGTNKTAYTTYGNTVPAWYVGTDIAATNVLDYGIWRAGNGFALRAKDSGTYTTTPVVDIEHNKVTINQPATFAGAVTIPAATTARASMRIPHGTAPTSPVDGDMWTTSAGLYIRINGATVGPLS